jgi:small subunit ribosomal protein S19
MAKKEFTYKGKKIEELKKLTPKEFAKMTNARVRRSIERGFNDAQKIFLEKLRKSTGKAVKTHCRDMVVLPEMIGRKIMVHNGKEYKQIIVTAEMLGQYLGEFSFTRNKVTHSSPGVGATKSSSNVSVK